MDFDTLLSLASKNQQEKLGVKRPVAVSTSLPAPKKIEKKQVDTVAIRRLIEEKQGSDVVNKPAQQKKQPAMAIKGDVVNARPLAGDKPACGAGAQHQDQKHSPVSMHGSASVNGQKQPANNGRGPLATPTPISKNTMPGSAQGSSNRRIAHASNALASDIVAASADSAQRTKEVAKPLGKDRTVPPKPVNYKDLMALAAAKASTASGGLSAAGPSAQDAAAARVGLASGQVKSAAADGRPAKPYACPAPDSNDDPTAQPVRRRKRRSKLPPELEDLLGISNAERRAQLIQPGHRGVNGKVNDTGGSSKAKDPKAAKLRDPAGPGKAGSASKPKEQPAAEGPAQPPKARAMSKEQLAVAILKKRKEAAAAAAAAAAVSARASSASTHGSQASKIRSETVVSRAGDDLRSSQGSRAHITQGASPAAAHPQKSPAGRTAVTKDNLDNWDKLIARASVNGKPKESRKRHVLDSDEDEYDEEMDDFIDDDDADMPRGDVSSMIQKMFGYDRSRYKDDDEDDRNMEARFADVMKEEARSARLGKLEDLEDMRMEEEHKKSKKRKK